MKHVINPGDRYGRLTVIAEVQKAAGDNKRYRAALCRCDCGKEITPRITSLRSGDTQSCGCSRGPPKYQQKLCPVCGTLAVIHRDHKSCSRACGYHLARAGRQALNPSYDVWHHRVTKARGPASGYACVDCGNPAQDWSTVPVPAQGPILDMRYPPYGRRSRQVSRLLAAQMTSPFDPGPRRDLRFATSVDLLLTDQPIQQSCTDWWSGFR